MSIVKVTQEMINKGRIGSAGLCPIALGVRAVAGEDLSIGVTYEYIRIEAIKYKVTRSALRFLKNFDYHKPAKPFNFRLIKKDS